MTDGTGLPELFRAIARHDRPAASALLDGGGPGGSGSDDARSEQLITVELLRSHTG